MKREIGLILCVVLVLCLTACGDNRADNSQKHTDNTSVAAAEPNVGDLLAEASEEQTGKVLVVYYSASGNTKAVGDTIAQYTGGDIFELIPVNAYTSEDLDWTNDGSRVNQEHEDESLQDIELVSTSADNFDSYDTIFIGYPNMEQGFNSISCAQRLKIEENKNCIHK